MKTINNKICKEEKERWEVDAIGSISAGGETDSGGARLDTVRAHTALYPIRL